MMTPDIGLMLFGMAVGTVVSAVFFAGLGYGVRLALRSARPTVVLLLSAALRIGAFLGCLWVTAQSGLWATLGFALAFLVVRLIAIALAGPREEARRPCN